MSPSFTSDHSQPHIGWCEHHHPAYIGVDIQAVRVWVVQVGQRTPGLPIIVGYERGTIPIVIFTDRPDIMRRTARYRTEV